MDLGEELARRLDVPFEAVVYFSADEIVDGMKAGAVDFTVIEVTAARAQVVDFTQAMFVEELGYLVPAGSPIRSIADIDKAGNRVGVRRRCPPERTLPKLLSNASVVPTPSVEKAFPRADGDVLAEERLDAFAADKTVLAAMRSAVGRFGAKVLDGRWSLQHVAVAIPKGREASHLYLRRFVEDVQRSGLLARVLDRTGYSGTTKPQ
jgi:polar amino acid transport system substrate-binding protein